MNKQKLPKFTKLKFFALFDDLPNFLLPTIAGQAAILKNYPPLPAAEGYRLLLKKFQPIRMQKKQWSH